MVIKNIQNRRAKSQEVSGWIAVSCFTLLVLLLAGIYIAEGFLGTVAKLLATNNTWVLALAVFSLALALVLSRSKLNNAEIRFAVYVAMIIPFVLLTAYCEQSLNWGHPFLAANSLQLSGAIATVAIATPVGLLTKIWERMEQQRERRRELDRIKHAASEAPYKVEGQRDLEAS